MMKPTKLHKELCDIVIEQATFWKCSNDIDSATHYCENQNVFNEMLLDNKITEEDAEQLIECLNILYHYVKNIGLNSEYDALEQLNKSNILESKDEPITEKWLLENGFERLHYFEPKLAFSSKDKRVEVVECENADEWNVHIDDNRSISLGNLCCTTTRQLIEFCRLCGYEFT